MYTRLTSVNRSFLKQICEPFLAGLFVGVIGSLLVLRPFQKYSYDTSDPYGHADTDVGPEISVGTHPETDPFHVMTDTDLADKLFNDVKVLCWIMTGPKNHETKAKHVKQTWGKRCNHLVFMSSKEDQSLGSVALPVVEDRDHLWQKTKEAMKYVHKHYYDKADWFFKADDDTYAVMENIRYLLSDQNSSEPIYFGCKFKPFAKQGYMSGGAGYVLSKEALKRFVKDALPDKNKCKKADTGAEDVEVGLCLESVGVKAGDSRDEEGRNRFLPLFLTDVLIPNNLPDDFWYWKYMFYPQKKGMECCSDSLATIHYVSPNQMYLLEYLIYHVRPFGIAFKPSLELKLHNHRDHNHEVEKTNTIQATENSVKEEKKEKKKTDEISWDDFD